MTKSNEKSEAKTSPNEIILSEVITRDELEISSVTIKKPDSGEMRGVSLLGIGQLMVDDLIKITPRITQPSLTVKEAARLPLCDLMAIGVKLSGFLLPSAKDMEDFQTE